MNVHRLINTHHFLSLSISHTYIHTHTHTHTQGRGGAAVTAVDGKIIVLCGFAGEETKDMYAFDIEKKAWEDWSEYRYVCMYTHTHTHTHTYISPTSFSVEEDKRVMYTFIQT
jgi:hypothetical protein